MLGNLFKSLFAISFNLSFNFMIQIGTNCYTEGLEKFAMMGFPIDRTNIGQVSDNVTLARLHATRSKCLINFSLPDSGKPGWKCNALPKHCRCVLLCLQGLARLLFCWPDGWQTHLWLPVTCCWQTLASSLSAAKPWMGSQQNWPLKRNKWKDLRSNFKPQEVLLFINFSAPEQLFWIKALDIKKFNEFCKASQDRLIQGKAINQFERQKI